MIPGKADVRGAYAQSVESHRKIFMEPPFRSKEDKLVWLLNTKSYGILLDGRKWQRKSHRIENDKLGMKISSCYLAVSCKKIR